MTSEQLCRLLTMKVSPVVTINGVTGILSSVEREDGSGKSFNVVLNTKEGKKVVYLRCH